LDPALRETLKHRAFSDKFYGRNLLVEMYVRHAK
jgi:hypothetical protein